MEMIDHAGAANAGPEHSKEAAMFLSQGVDYLGFLNAKLRDLEGWSALANELIQNADDADGATSIMLDVTDRALIVSNDAQFSDCGAVREQRCAWDPIGDGKKCCDFHAFRRVASGHKRVEEDTTGAFGIGFISVYQITDQPDLQSGRWHWRLDPGASEERRIFAEHTSVPFDGTRFTFPWALEQTPLRTALGRIALPRTIVAAMAEELRMALLRAAPFLKRLTVLDLRINGEPALKVECDREASTGDILVVADGVARVWKRVTAEFEVVAANLRQKYGSRIEKKRKAFVTVGVPLDHAPDHGLLYASLPTEHQVELPVLINADFFPSTNRKQVLFDKDYQGEWNRAAIGAAAQAFTAAVPKLRDSLSATGLWNLLSRARALHTAAASGAIDGSFKSFWDLAKPVIRANEVVLSSRGAFCLPASARSNAASKEASDCLPLLEALGLNIVHSDLRSHYTLLREVGVPDLDLDALTTALRDAKLSGPVSLDDAPAWLRNANNRQALAILIESLLARVAREKLPAARDRLLNSSLWLTVGGNLAPAAQLWYGDESTRDLVRIVNTEDIWESDANPPELTQLVPRFTLARLTHLLVHAGSDTIRAANEDHPGWVRKLIIWIDDHHVELSQLQGLKARIRSLPIWPSGGTLRPLDGLSVPGNFDDPLNLAQVLDAALGAEFRSLLVNHLGAKELDLRTYLIDHVPAAFAENREPAPETRRNLVALLARHIGEIRADDAVQRALSKLPLAECENGEFRSPRALYLRSPELVLVLGDAGTRYVHPVPSSDPGVAEALRWLGVQETPEPADVLAAIDSVLALPNDADRESMRTLFRGLVGFWPGLLGRRAELAVLKTKAWLPAAHLSGWHPPSNLFTGFRAFLFHSQAKFLDVPQPIQAAAQVRPAPDKESLIEFLGIRGEPTCSMVVEHLLHEAREGRKVNLEVFSFLELHHADAAVQRLRDQRSLPVESGYIRPAQALLSTHSFGRFRYRLGPEWLRFAKLLAAIGVGTEPTVMDAVSVLEEIAEDYSSDRRQLQPPDEEAVYACWSLLTTDGMAHQADWASRLAPLGIVPNARKFLHRPVHVFFEDRPGLAARFDEAVQNSTIRRPEIAWVAMAAAGVRDLSKVVETRVVECSGPMVSDRWSSILFDRWPLVRRVMSSLPAVAASVAPADPPEVWDTSALKVCFALDDRVTEAEDAAAVLDPASARLYVSRGRKGAEAAVARELAFMMNPDAGAGLLAAALKELLAADSIEEAATALSDLGFADIVLGNQSATSAEAPEMGLDSGDAAFYDDQRYETEVRGDPVLGESDAAEPGAATDPKEGSSSEASGGGRRRESSGGDKTANIGRERGAKSTTKAKFIGKSFVQPAKTGEQSESTEGNQRNLDIDRLGTSHVIAYELQQGRDPRKQDHFQKGYDVESFGRDGILDRYIEVKSMSAGWDMSNVGLSAAQFQMARAEGSRFWLYVVDRVESSTPGLYLIQDPAAKVTEYRFDDGWKQVAINVVAGIDLPASSS